MPRVKLRTPTIEIEIEGEEDFLAKRARELLSELWEYAQGLPVSGPFPASDSAQRNSGPTLRADRAPREGTVNTLVARVGGSSCRQVLLAAAAHLTLFQGKDRFTDDEWEATARAANAWKSKWTNQKATQKKRLVDSGAVIENSSGVYSLSSSSLADLENKLAQP